MNKIKIALVGQPNVGKSMLINSISNSKLKVGNFAGVTVEKAEACLTFHGAELQIVDLPGSYSLNDYSLDERVTKEFLENEQYDLILNVVDSTNLERNLALTYDLLELNKKMVIALNMSDEAKFEGIEIDWQQMSLLLGVPCVEVSAKEKLGLDELLNLIVDSYTLEKLENKLIYSEPVEEEIEYIATFFETRKFSLEGFDNKLIAYKLLKKDKEIYKRVKEEPIWPELLPILRVAYDHLYVHHNTKDIEEIFESEKDSFLNGVLAEAVKVKEDLKESFTEKADKILLHKFFGIPIFLFMMWSLFQITFELGSLPMSLIDSFFSKLGEGVGILIAHEETRSLIVDGIIAGVGAVVLFLPNIVILFLGIALLETTGYISRVAFLLDGFFHKFGLHGKSFIPLVSGFGCSVPAYMAARTLKNKKDRLVTMFIIGFMSCGAKLPVYVLFVGAFFGDNNAGNILFIIYIFGALLGLVSAKFLEKFIFNGDDEPFVMEMPKYRFPSLTLIWHMVSTKALMYLKKAGTFILAASVLIWFASSYPKNIELEEKYAHQIERTIDSERKKALENQLSKDLLEQSYLGTLGKMSEPFFAPLGFDWRLAVALESGLAAKEVIVATLGVLYSLGDEVDESSEGLIATLKKEVPIPTALAFLTFVMFYLPCLAATTVFAKEAGEKKYLYGLIIFTTVVSYLMAFIVYTVAEILV